MRVLSIRGGGIKGLLPACVLADFEARTGVRCRDAFDLIAGTSTGGILALALSRGIEAARVRDMYLERGPEIFARRFWSRFGLLAAKYDVDRLRHALESVFDRSSLAECGDVMVCATNVETGGSAFIKSWRNPDVRIVDAACATAAAPTYFDPVELEGFGLLADGGMFANNPASFALTQARKLFFAKHPTPSEFRDGGPNEAWYQNQIEARISLVDLSCGATNFVGRTGSRWGALQYASQLVELFIDSGVDAAAHQCAVDLGDDYLGLEPSLGAASKRMDDASASNLRALLDAGVAAGVELGPKLAEFVERSF